ncbi:hypothetical protein IW136_000835 [Coemansia sp. RSA 678]|nr:hypothetical protein IW136_000835 [Coemansia sp. RSA 678]
MKITLGLALVAAGSTVSAHPHVCPFAKRQQVGPNTGNNAGLDNESIGQVPNANGNNGQSLDNTGFGQVPAGNNNEQFPLGDNTGFGNGLFPSGDNTGIGNGQLPSGDNTGFGNGQFPSGNNGFGNDQFPSGDNTGFNNQFPSDANNQFPSNANNQFPANSINNNEDALLNSLIPTAPSQQQSTLGPNNEGQTQSIPSSIFDDLPGFLGISFPGQIDPDATITPQSQNTPNIQNNDDNIRSATNRQTDAAQDSSNSAMLPRHTLVTTAMLLILIL